MHKRGRSILSENWTNLTLRMIEKYLSNIHVVEIQTHLNMHRHIQDDLMYCIEDYDELEYKYELIKRYLTLHAPRNCATYDNDSNEWRIAYILLRKRLRNENRWWHFVTCFLDWLYKDWKRNQYDSQDDNNWFGVDRSHEDDFKKVSRTYDL